MTTPLRDVLRQALEADLDLDEVQEIVRRDGGPEVAAEVADLIGGEDPDLAMVAAGAAKVLDWDKVRPALESLDPHRLPPVGRSIIAMLFIEEGDDPPFTLTRRDVISGFASGIERMSDDDIEAFLEDVGATPEELEEVLGELVSDTDEWGRPVVERTPLGSFRETLSDELVDVSGPERGALLDTAYLLDDFLDGWTDCSGPEEVTVGDLVGFAGWYLIAHTAAAVGSILEHIERLPRVVAIIDRHFDTHLGDHWKVDGAGLAADVGRAIEATDLIARDLGGPCANAEDAEEGHWQFLGVEDHGARLRRLEDGQERCPVTLAPDALARLPAGSVMSVVVGRRGPGWVLFDAGPVYPARVAQLFEDVRPRRG